MAEVDTQQRCRAPAGDLGRAQDGAVSPEHNHNLEITDLHGLAEDRQRLEIAGDGTHVGILLGGQHRGEPGGLQLAAHLDGCVE